MKDKLSPKIRSGDLNLDYILEEPPMTLFHSERLILSNSNYSDIFLFKKPIIKLLYIFVTFTRVNYKTAKTQ